jgi:DNA-binding winged helix-turn-helix (wHTH) protein
MKVRFGTFLFDSTQRVLSHAGERLGLSPKAVSLLELLLRERPRAVAKMELQERLWPGTFVVEANLPNLIAEIRRGLEDTKRPHRFLRTVHGFGYAFCGEAVDLEGAERRRYVYRVRWDSGSASLRDGEHVVGRDPKADVHLDMASVSRYHARLCLNDGHMVIEDVGSRNGTFVRGQKIKARSPITLKDGEWFRMGGVPVIVSIARAADARETDAMD